EEVGCDPELGDQAQLLLELGPELGADSLGVPLTHSLPGELREPLVRRATGRQLTGKVILELGQVEADALGDLRSAPHPVRPLGEQTQHLLLRAQIGLVVTPELPTGGVEGDALPDAVEDVGEGLAGGHVIPWAAAGHDTETE